MQQQAVSPPAVIVEPSWARGLFAGWAPGETISRSGAEQIETEPPDTR